MTAHSAIVAASAERVEIVDNAARLAAVGPAWTRLWQEVDGLIFQSHAWVSAWWSTVPDRDERRLRIGLLWRGEQLLAVMPLAISRRKGLRLLEWAANATSDYEDVLAARDCSPQSVQLLWSELSAVGGYDLALLNRLQPDARAHALMDQRARTRLAPSVRFETSYRVSGDWPTGAAWLNEQPKKTRQNYRRGRKALEEMGPLTFRLLPPDTPLGPVLERVAELKRKWLSERDRVSILFDAGTKTLAATVGALARAGVLHVFVLESAGTIIAVSINFVQRGTMMAFITTYDPAFEKGSPGTVLMMDYIQWSIDHGLKTTDFLCGAEAFKRRFATQAVNLSTLAGSRTPAGAMALLAERVRNDLRGAIEHWRERKALKAQPVAEAAE